MTYYISFERSWNVEFNVDIFENINWNNTIEKTQKPWNYTLKFGMSMKTFK